MPRGITEVLQDKLQQSGVSPVYISDAPSLQLECVNIRLPDGYASSYYFGKMEIEEPLVEIVIRSKNYEKGANWYSQIKKILDQWSSPDDGVLSCLLTGSPGYLGRDIRGYNEWHMLFHISI